MSDLWLSVLIGIGTVVLISLIVVLKYRQKTKPPSLHLAARDDKGNDKKKK